ncbi:MAG TPA: phage tail protein [Pirellulaceae bacterium]|nr:phage tail protein [Pirellulaceae bacterium]
MSLTPQQVYELLPAIYRLRDEDHGKPLAAFIAVLAEQAGIVEADIQQLYDNWFVETCEEWVVPYLGDLLGVRGLHAVRSEAKFSHRARVADSLRFRRRKGTATMLEQAARDATGYSARAVEFFELLATTQYANHVRHANHRTPDLRQAGELELLDSAFDRIAHTADVRSIALGRGRHNIPNVGLFLWRLQSYFVTKSAARAAADPSDGRYTFSPLGQSQPLVNRPQTEEGIAHLAQEVNVPGMLRRRPLYDELEAWRQALVDSGKPTKLYFGDKPVLQVFVQPAAADPLEEVPPQEILICNLSDPPNPVPEIWLRPPTTKNYKRSSDQADVPRDIRLAVDPVLGRIAFPAGVVPHAVKVSYAYAFSADVGGGPYGRRESVSAALENRPVNWQIAVSKQVPPVAGEIVATLTEAVQTWNAQPAGTVGVIAILDSDTYAESLVGAARIEIPAASLLLVVAADWPKTPVPGVPGQEQRAAGSLAPEGRRPHVLGDISVRGTGAADSAGALAIDGLLIEGALTVEGGPGTLVSLRLSHSTLVPGKGGLNGTAANDRLKIDVRRSIVGGINVAPSTAVLEIEESIVDLPGGVAIAGGASPAKLEACTVFGRTEALRLEASNCIFTERVACARQQEGCLRFSFVPPGSQTPRRFRCQPDLALEGVPASQQSHVVARVAPAFTSSRYGDHAYGQLSAVCAEEIRTGADDGAEMGVFRFLQQPQRETNLRTVVEEYLRFGLEAGWVFVT